MSEEALDYDTTPSNAPTQVNEVKSETLNNIVTRIERLESEKSNIAEDIKAVYAEAKAEGFDTKTLREIIKLRKKDESEIEAAELLLMTYKRALGMPI